MTTCDSSLKINFNNNYLDIKMFHNLKWLEKHIFYNINNYLFINVSIFINILTYYENKETLLHL